MEWPRIDGHTPGPWYSMGKDVLLDREGFHCLAAVAKCVTRIGAPSIGIDEARSNASLLVLFGPHLCDVPDCPGPKLVAKLEAAGEVARAALRLQEARGAVALSRISRAKGGNGKRLLAELHAASLSLDVALAGWDSAR